MRTRAGRSLALASLLFAAAVLVAPLAANAAPGVGDPAPDFTLPGSDGVTHTLADLRGQYVVIAFFPKAFTGG
jgi:peroxiredoxin Q/BCP